MFMAQNAAAGNKNNNHSVWALCILGEAKAKDATNGNGTWHFQLSMPPTTTSLFLLHRKKCY